MEKILCAAIWYNDGIVHVHQPKNVSIGFVICGRRHHNCYATAGVFGLAPGAYEHEQGFVTTEDRFVLRPEAYNIAVAAGQLIHEGDCKIHVLISEDLY